MSETIARAIRTVIKREQREREVAETIEATNRRIDALEALLGGRPRSSDRPEAPDQFA